MAKNVARKFMALTLAAVMVLTMTAGAYAEEVKVDTDVSKSEQETTVKTIEDYTLIYGNWNEEMTEMERYELAGTFEGEVINDIANGKGKFTVNNEDGTGLQYEGAFKDGTFNGIGVLKVTGEEKTVPFEGHFENGAFVPNKAETLLAALRTQTLLDFEDDGIGNYKISAKGEKAIKNCDSMFGKKISYLSKNARSVKHSNLVKKRTYDGKLLKIKNLKVLDIDSLQFFGQKITTIFAQDANKNKYMINYVGDTKVSEKNKIDVYGYCTGVEMVEYGSIYKTPVIGAVKVVKK